MLERIRLSARGSATPAPEPTPTITLAPREVTLLRLTGVASFEALEAEPRDRMERGCPPGRIVEVIGADGVPTLRAKTYPSLFAAAVDFRIADCEGRSEWDAAEIREHGPVASFWALLRDGADVLDVEPLRRASAARESRPSPEPPSIPTSFDDRRSVGEARIAVFRESVRRRIANFDATQAEKARDDRPDLRSVANAQIAAALDALRAAHPELEGEFELVAGMMRER